MASIRTTLAVCAVVVGVYAGALAGYLGSTAAFVDQHRYYLYPLVWLLVATLVVLRVRTPADRSLTAAGIAVGYFILLAAVSGSINIGGTGGGLLVQSLPPGWGPFVAYDGTLLSLSVVPFQTIGHLSLAYLVYVAVARASGSTALVGLVGFATCIGCVWPFAAALAAALSGGAALASVGPYAYDLSTVLFLLTVASMWILLARTSIGEPPSPEAVASPTD